MKVLIVDDVASNLKLLRVTLEAEGVTVGEATDGVAALSALESEDFDAVISDILIPRMDGYRLYREIVTMAFGFGAAPSAMHRDVILILARLMRAPAEAKIISAWSYPCQRWA